MMAAAKISFFKLSVPMSPSSASQRLAATRRASFCLLLTLSVSALLPGPAWGQTANPTGKWLQTVWPYKGSEVSFSTASNKVTANGHALSKVYSSPVLGLGFGPCPSADETGTITPQVSFPIYYFLSLVNNIPQIKSSGFSSNSFKLSSTMSWATEFYFQTTSGGCTEQVWTPFGKDTDACGSGFTFVVQSVGATAIGFGDANLGYGGLKNSLAVEFDMAKTDANNDPNGNHVAVLTDGVVKHKSATDKSIARWPRTFNDMNVKRVAIVYDAGFLKVYIADTPVNYPKLALSYKTAMPSSLNLSKTFVGFTAATGSSSQTMALRVFNWRFLYADPATAKKLPAPSLPVERACPAPPPSPPNPSPPPKQASTLYILSGDYIYICKKPIDLSSCAAAGGVTSTGAWNTPFNLKIYQGKAYISSYSGISICSDPNTLQNCQLTYNSGAIFDVEFYGGKAYLAAGFQGVVVCDDPANLKKCIEVLYEYGVTAITFQKSKAYIAYDYGVQVCDDPPKLTKCKSYFTDSPAPYDVEFSRDGSLLYVMEGRSYMNVCSKAETCTQVPLPSLYGTTIAWVGSQTYIGTTGGLYVCTNVNKPDQIQCTSVDGFSSSQITYMTFL